VTQRESASFKFSGRFPFSSNGLHDFHATPLRHGALALLQPIDITRLFRMLPQADDLEALKAQIEALNARVAAMEAAPTAPAGYQLLAISEGDRVNIPGLEMTSRDRALYGE